MYLIENSEDRANIKIWEETYLYELIDHKRIFSSKEAKSIYLQLLHAGAIPELGHNYDWATLCIGYCLIKGIALDKNRLRSPPDSKGFEISSFKTCFQDYSHLWLAVLSENLFILNEAKDGQSTKDDLYNYIQALWHTGAVELMEFWEKCQAFKSDSHLEARQEFLEELAQLAYNNTINDQFALRADVSILPERGEIQQLQNRINNALLKSQIQVKSIEFATHGVRYDIFKLRLNTHVDLKRRHEQICSALGIEPSNLQITPSYDNEPFTYLIKILRESSQWKNLDRQLYERSINDFENSERFILPICIGVDEKSNAVFEDLAKAPHLMVAGATGSGKSVCVRTIVHSLFDLKQPSVTIEVTILDPKQGVDYKQDFHNKANLIIDINEMHDFLNKMVNEMEDRYTVLQVSNAHNISKYNSMQDVAPMSYHIIIIDELADLVDSNKEVEEQLVRLAQKARASGIHLILSTQRPDSATFSGRLRSNIPSRIACRVLRSSESNIILGEAGAEQLIGSGDHLVKWDGSFQTRFLHGFNL